MVDRYFVAQTPGAGVIGLLAGPEVRRRLAAGDLPPTFVGLPERATGDVRGQWRPLGEIFAGLAAEPPRPRLRLRVPAAAWLMAAGAAVAAGGVVVRVQARAWTWPDHWSYSGDRANTSWAHHEALYIDLGLAALALGLGLVLLGVWRAVR
jgi:hypothetical protein